MCMSKLFFLCVQQATGCHGFDLDPQNKVLAYIDTFFKMAMSILRIKITILETHCNIAETFLSDMCTTNCKVIGPPAKMIVAIAQNTRRDMDPQKQKP